jgi:hypothetical protein
MAELLFINPRPKRVKKRATAKRRKTMATQAQLRALRKARAARRANLRAANPKRRRRRARRRNPTARTAAYRRVRTIRTANPRRRRRRSYARRRRNPVSPMYRLNPRRRRRSYARRRSNPRRMFRRGGMLENVVFPALTATAGAVLLDIAWSYLPIPVNVKAGPLRHAWKAAGAIGMVWGVSKIPKVDKKLADALGVGALTIIAYQTARDVITRFFPELGVKLNAEAALSGIGYYSAGLPAGGYADGGMGMYVPSTPALSQGDQNAMGMYVGEYMYG